MTHARAQGLEGRGGPMGAGQVVPEFCTPMSVPISDEEGEDDPNEWASEEKYNVPTLFP